MTSQIPLLISDDAKMIISRVKHTYPGARLPLSQLQTCWRPPGPPARPWPDKRFWKALEEAEASGQIRRVVGFCGTELEMTA